MLILSQLKFAVSGFGFFDVGANDIAAQAKRRRPQIGTSVTFGLNLTNTSGKRLTMSEY